MKYWHWTLVRVNRLIKSEVPELDLSGNPTNRELSKVATIGKGHGKGKPDSAILAQNFQWWSMNLNFSGVWKGNLEKSKLLGPAPKAVLVRINHADPELIVEMVITKMDNTEDRLLFRGLTTGEEVANPVHGIQVRSCSRWVGTELLIESWMNLGGRQGHFRDYWSLSSDGRTLTMEHRDDDLAGQITLLERTHAH